MSSVVSLPMVPEQRVRHPRRSALITPPTFLPSSARLGWRIGQAFVLAIGVAIVVLLAVRPHVGLVVLWDGLIPVAPALLVVAPGLWRNVCPLGTAATLGRHLGLSQAKRLSPRAQAWLSVGGIALLFTIIPLRHVLLDTNGPLTAAVLLATAAVAVSVGIRWDWKSAWCNALCPVHPVEQLYGSRPVVTPRNAHCESCSRCTTLCADSTLAMQPGRAPAPPATRLAQLVFVGGFPGFVWGWFQLPTWESSAWRSHIGVAYAVPLSGLAATLVLFVLARRLWPGETSAIARVFGAAAVTCYYFYRLPLLFGFADPSSVDVLVNLRSAVPGWFPFALQVTTTVVLGAWLLLYRPARRAWLARPPYAQGLRHT